jgi:hypothetical protein
LFFRVKNHTKALRKIDEVRRAFGRDLKIAVDERYWKDKNLWECSFWVEGADGSAADVVLDCLVLAARLGNGWYVLGLGGDGAVENFGGVLNGSQGGRPHIMGLEWASFDLISPRTEGEPSRAPVL